MQRNKRKWTERKEREFRKTVFKISYYLVLFSRGRRYFISWFRTDVWKRSEQSYQYQSRKKKNQVIWCILGRSLPTKKKGCLCYNYTTIPLIEFPSTYHTPMPYYTIPSRAITVPYQPIPTHPVPSHAILLFPLWWANHREKRNGCPRSSHALKFCSFS